MYAIIGILVVFAAVFGGFLLEHGNLFVSLQPVELLILGGAAAGIVIVANPPSVILRVCRGAIRTFRPPPPYAAGIPAPSPHVVRGVQLHAARRGGGEGGGCRGPQP